MVNRVRERKSYNLGGCEMMLPRYSDVVQGLIFEDDEQISDMGFILEVEMAQFSNWLYVRCNRKWKKKKIHPF